MRFARLLEQATPGPWSADDGDGPRSEATPDAPYLTNLGGEWINAADARLIALAPDMARLLIDMAELLSESITFDGEWESESKALLARFAELDKQAAR